MEVKETIGFEGLYFKFPFQTEQKTYQFWDGSLGEAPDIEFQDAETIEGLEVYRFEQVDRADDRWQHHRTRIVLRYRRGG